MPRTPKRTARNPPKQERKVNGVADHYTYRVSWSPEDEEFVATCAEFPSLSHLAPDAVEALLGIRRLIGDVVSDMRENNEAVPVPLADRAYSGRFMTRIPGALHRRLAMEAAEEGVSLNRLVSNKLAMPNTVLVRPSAPETRTKSRRRQMAGA